MVFSLVRLSGDTRLLVAARLARSIGQGALVVDFSLYLHALGWRGAEIGALLMANLLAGSALTVVAGPLSDRVGRRRFLLGYEAMQIVGAAIALATSQPALLIMAALLGSYGRGANGAAGPFAPVEQAWLAETLPRADFGRVYSLGAGMGFLGMSLGAFAAALPALLSPALPGPLAYRPLFALVALGSLITLLLLLRARETFVPGQHADKRSGAEHASGCRTENSLLLRLVGVNALNGIGLGLVGPLMAYWLAVKFGRGPASIGPVMGYAFLMGALGSLCTGWLSGRLDMVRAVVWMRTIGLMTLLLLPLAPTFALAAALFIVRSAFNQGTLGARQALSISLVRAHRRGLAASVNTISNQLPRAVGPVIAGVFFDGGLLSLPFFIAGGFQVGYLWLYQRLFSRFARPQAPPGERPAPSG
ncbi:MAG: MFS transporter [Candidatus Lambdaproteobacteria bacterium]|nr:MFS transporter [Candidatus Lambdaproteobacteria bacterium]